MNLVGEDERNRQRRGCGLKRRGDVPSTRLRPRRELGRTLAEVCGTLSTFLAEDEIPGDCSHPQQRGIFLRTLNLGKAKGDAYKHR